MFFLFHKRSNILNLQVIWGLPTVYLFFLFIAIFSLCVQLLHGSPSRTARIAVCASTFIIGVGVIASTTLLYFGVQGDWDTLFLWELLILEFVTIWCIIQNVFEEEVGRKTKHQTVDLERMTPRRGTSIATSKHEEDAEEVWSSWDDKGKSLAPWFKIHPG